MTKDNDSRHNRPLRVRLLGEETGSEKYRRLGWDPRKTYEENMGTEGMFDRPDEELEWPGFDLTPSRKPSRAVRTLAAKGRGEDTEIAHLTPGELVVPESLQTPEFMAALERAAAAHGIPLEMLKIGHRMNRINPNTGAPEFGLLSGFGNWLSKTFGMGTANAAETPEVGSAQSAAQAVGQQPPYRYNGPEIDGITVTTPIEKGLVQLPQNLPKNGFYNYTPLRNEGPSYANGEAQYGMASTMHLIGEVGSQWHANGEKPFGVGDLSLFDGSKYGHKGHQNGQQFDMRPIRRDGRREGVTWEHPAYDREATQRLVDMLRATGGVKTIYFNDPHIKGVTRLGGHDNHLHIEVDPTWRRR